MIGNAHLDPVWLWRWPEGFEAARATFRSALDRMNEEPDFIFTSSQAAVYEWIERGDPGLLAEIRARVAEGRWRIVGGWWMQTDCNIPSGESFVRQGLYGQRYFQEKLGTTSVVGYNVDSFGHNYMLPQILSKSGMPSYVFMRPGPHENPEIPKRLFWWESPDGSRVLTFKIPESYCSWGEWMEEKLRRSTEDLASLPEIMEFYGVGNHGGGPTKDNLERIDRMRSDESLPEIKYSAPDLYFASVSEKASDLPVWRDDMQHHASGCYAAHSGIKKDNRALEHLLDTAERLSVLADVYTGLGYPKDDLSRAWKCVLFNQFHDILAGTSIEEAYDDARDLHGMAYQLANESITYASGAVASRIDTQGAGEPIVVFNPLSWERNDYCECELHCFGPAVRVLDDSGADVPSQVVRPSASLPPGGRTRVLFPATVGSVGYSVYRAVPESIEYPSPLTVTATSLENESICVSLDPATGQIVSIIDKRRGIETMSSPSDARVIDDPSDTWSHNVFTFANVIGTFGGARLEIIEQGPVRASTRSTSTYGGSTLVQEYRLYAGSAYVECDCTIDWHEHLKMLKLAFPVNAVDPKVTYETQYGHIHRPANGEEEPGLSWIDLSGAVGGLCLVNDSKYSYSVEDSTMSLTVLRSPVYAHHDPYVLEPNGSYRFIDQGESRFRYRLVPHAGAWSSTRPHRLGQELNSPLRAVIVSNHPGDLPTQASFIDVSAPNVMVSAIKSAEDGDGLIVRCFETDGIRSTCSFRLTNPSAEWTAELGPSEIKTFLISGGQAVETDLLERRVGG